MRSLCFSPSCFLVALIGKPRLELKSVSATMIVGRFLTLLSTVLASVKFAGADLVDGYGLEERAATDPCATIGGKTWVSPADVRACYQSFPVNETIKANVSNFSFVQ